MTGSRHSRAEHSSACGLVLWRAVGAVARALRHIHHEQVVMWDCWLRVNRVPVDRAGPLAWEPSLDGPRLIGCSLPASGTSGPGGRP